MFIGVARPLGKACQRRLLMSLQKGTHAELGGEALRQFVLCAHGRFEVVKAMAGHEQGMWQVQEGCYATLTFL